MEKQDITTKIKKLEVGHHVYFPYGLRPLVNAVIKELSDNDRKYAVADAKSKPPMIRVHRVKPRPIKAVNPRRKQKGRTAPLQLKQPTGGVTLVKGNKKK